MTVYDECRNSFVGYFDLSRWYRRRELIYTCPGTLLKFIFFVWLFGWVQSDMAFAANTVSKNPKKSAFARIVGAAAGHPPVPRHIDTEKEFSAMQKAARKAEDAEFAKQKKKWVDGVDCGTVLPQSYGFYDRIGRSHSIKYRQSTGKKNCNKE